MSTFGPEYDEVRDGSRLHRQHIVIRDLMLDGKERGLGMIARITGYPEASISAQLRHLRKEKFGGYVVTKRHVKNGLYMYRVAPPDPQGQLALPGIQS